ncbi:PrgI family protein [Faecalibaculum rodentium]|uniref:PrgI family protein n=1 Tax=Faecalibaculum rodentium TaxID=1702221 RepID=UPI00255ADC7A|nr:PrgI family protein [Faecalibaculum rodentium]
MNDMINTKVRTHKNLYGVAEKFYGFTARQWIFLILAFVICIPGYLWLKPVIGEELTSWLVILTGGPIILMGFVDIQGLSLPKLIPFLVRHFIDFNKPLTYKTQKQLDQEAWERSREGRKAKKQKANEARRQEKLQKGARSLTAAPDKPTGATEKAAQGLEGMNWTERRRAFRARKREEKARAKNEELERQQTRELAMAMRRHGVDPADVTVSGPFLTGMHKKKERRKGDEKIPVVN